MICSGTPVTIGQMFEDNARRIGDDIAVICGDEQRTHRELFQNGCRLAVALEELGMRKQDRMAVLSMNNIEFIEAYVAGWTAVYVVATVNFRLALPEIIWILNDIAPKVLLIEGQYAALIPAICEHVPEIESVVVIGGGAPGAHDYGTLLASVTRDMPGTRASEGDIASLIYTSGTTGRPKGCIMGQRENALNTHVLVTAMGNRPGDRFLCVMPLFHIGAMAIALCVLTNGGTVYVHRQFDPATVVEALDSDAITACTHDGPYGLATARCRSTSVCSAAHDHIQCCPDAIQRVASGDRSVWADLPANAGIKRGEFHGMVAHEHAPA